MPIKPWLISPEHTRDVYVGAGGGGDSARDAQAILWHALRVGDGRLCAASPITRINPRAWLRARAHTPAQAGNIICCTALPLPTCSRASLNTT